MQIFTPIIALLHSRRRIRGTFSGFFRFLLILCAMILSYSVMFHFIMRYEGHSHTWMTGLYWTLTVMSTLGFGDITFTSDLGRIFSVIVLLSGIIFLMVLLPFTFIQHFYIPWMENIKKDRVPRELPPETKGHIILAGLGPMTINLANDLTRYGYSCVLLCKDTQTTTDLLDRGYNAVMGEHDDGETYRRLRLANAAMLVAMDNDQRNTNIVFTARDVAPHAIIAARVENAAAVDIMQLAGSTHVYQFREVLGKALARRVLKPDHPSSILSTFNQLVVAEAPVMRTPLVGKTLMESGLRKATGLNVVGVWQRGKFTLPTPQTQLSDNSVIVTAGTSMQTAALNAYLQNGAPRTGKKANVIILGGGHVGQAAASHLRQYGIMASVVDKRDLSAKCENAIQGDAAELEILEKSGLHEASTIIITTNDDDIYAYLTIYCRHLRPDIQIISRATFERNVGILHAAGADLVLSLSSMLSNTLLNQLSPGKVLMLNEGLNIFRFPVSKKLIGQNLRDCGIRALTNCSVVAVQNTDSPMSINPQPDYVFSAGDELYLIGDSASERAYQKNFGQ
ncbi:MAG: NAD-binding protein [Desulfovibrionaceae bacterium]|nr:NAD-binding protein [Desulfovibrionaceae bacterium]